MDNDHSKWKPKEKADLMIGFSYICFGLAGLAAGQRPVLILHNRKLQTEEVCRRHQFY
jgi:hypothetical protein